MKGWGTTPRDPCSVSTNKSYHEDQEYIWFRGGILTVSKILGFLWSEGGGHIPGEPKFCAFECVLL